MFDKKVLILVIFCVSLLSFSFGADDFTSKLSEDPKEVLRFDIDGDGDPDVLERWFNGKRCRWIDENDDMTATDLNGDIVSDCLQVDLNDDGAYDGYEDMCVKWVDNDGDGVCDAQVIAINTKESEETKWAGMGLYMVIEDVDRDGVMGYMDWSKFDLSCWRNTGRCNFSPDYNGDSIFLKAHLATFAVTDARWNWENPFAFYDLDDDGCSEMAVRLIDDFPCSSKLDSAYITIDVDNDTQRDNEFDYDFTLLFQKKSAYDYTTYVHLYPDLKAAEWVLPYFQYTEWRVIDELMYVPHEQCYETAFSIDWDSCYFTFDEDDDDHRWERVELYHPGDPYTLRWTEEQKASGKAAMNRHAQSDTLGDRGEFDLDNSGKGKLYFSAWDGRLHLYGAEKGAWLIDANAEYNGAIVMPSVCSKEIAKKLQSLVLYEDTNGNGFFDLIKFDGNGDKEPELTVNLLEYGTDICDLIDPAKVKWQGLHEQFKTHSKQSWRQARTLYRAFWRTGLSNKEIDDLAFASSTWEKYFHAAKLKEAIFERLAESLNGDKELLKKLYYFYFRGDFDGMGRWIQETDFDECSSL